LIKEIVVTHPNPMHYRDCLITANATNPNSKPGQWRGEFTIERTGFSPVTELNLAYFESKDEAEQQALSLACIQIDRRFFGG
jgi:hypothetical protein